MAVTAVIGSQWGDEGKGKVVDFLSQQADYVARFNGGNNAGHTVINEYGTFKIHLVPSGIFSQNTVGLIGGGVVIDQASPARRDRHVEQGRSRPGGQAVDIAALAFDHALSQDPGWPV